MADPTLERRVRAALRAEADALGFTITAADLERRAGQRRRAGSSGRRVALLLAAAVATSMLAIAGLGGAFRPTVTIATGSPRPSALPSSTRQSSATAVNELPSLDDLARIDPGAILVAQAHGPADGNLDWWDHGPLPDPMVILGTIDSEVDYVVSIGCLSGAPNAQLFLDAGIRPIPSGPPIPCDGLMHDAPVRAHLPSALGFELFEQGSWRAVLRGPSSAGGDGPVGALPRPPSDQEEVIRWDAAPLDAAAQPWGSDGLVVQEVGVRDERVVSIVEALCAAGPPVHVLFGDESNRSVIADTETLLRCTPTEPARVVMTVPGPFGRHVFIAATPGQAVSVAVWTFRTG